MPELPPSTPSSSAPTQAVTGAFEISDLTRTVRTKTTPCGCGCWVWTGALDRSGYATAKIKGQQVSVHRYVHDRLIGPIDGDLTVDHLCDRHRSCINPAHFELVTRSENSRRANHRRFYQTSDSSACTITTTTNKETSP